MNWYEGMAETMIHLPLSAWGKLGFPAWIPSWRAGIVLVLSIVTTACANVDANVVPAGSVPGSTPVLDVYTFLPTVSSQSLEQPADDWWRPRPGTSWQWQLSGPVDTTVDVTMYDIDLFDVSTATLIELHNDGRIVICYFSAGSWEDWRPDARDFPANLLGNALEGWPDERWLDIRQIDLLAPVLLARLDLAAAKGCDGVEPDNVDGYANASGFPLTGPDQLAYNRWLAQSAHERGLSIGLKNDLDQIPDLVGVFDWALNEQCVEFDECERLLPFVLAGKAVFGVEYAGDPAEFCPAVNALNFDWLHKRLDLDVWRVACR